MKASMQGACVVALLGASTVVAQPASAPSKAGETQHADLAAGREFNSSLKQETVGRIEPLPAEKAHAGAVPPSKLAAGESLWHRWNDLS
jgi:hypothetical protein